MGKETKIDLEAGFFEAYASATTNLRTWLVAYGIGAPILFVSNSDLWNALVKSKCTSCVNILYLIGVGSQIIISMINKYVMWGCYYGEGKPAFKEKNLYLICNFISEQFWIDILCDVLSITCFIIATFIVFDSVINVFTLK